MSNLANPHQDIHKLFESFNKQFFYGRLVGVEVRWSLRMTRCAGLCVYRKKKNYCSVRLSAPLLKLRPHSDMVDTMLHEMIHAYLFLTQIDNQYDGHGPRFHEHKDRINKEAGTNITVYHSFLDEIKLYKQHWWRCNGNCQNEPPYFGIVKRSMNRAPGPYDLWWKRHQMWCNGVFTKIREPIEFTMKKAAKEGKQVASSKTIRDITNICDKSSSSVVTDSTKNPTITLPTRQYGLENIVGFVDLTNSVITGPSATRESPKRKHNSDVLVEIDLTDEPPKKLKKIDNIFDVLCKCPVCSMNLNRVDMKEHLEVCEGLQGVFDDDEDDLVDVFDDKEIEENNKTQQRCAICALPVEGDMKNHLDYCLNNSGLVNIFDEPTTEFSEANTPSEQNKTSEANFGFNFNNNTKSHLSMNKYFSLNVSTDSCQSVKSVCDEHTKKIYNRCSVCKKNFNQVDMQEHLEVCKRLQGVFDLVNVFDDKEIEENNNNDRTKSDSPTNDLIFNASTDSSPSVRSFSEQLVQIDATHNSSGKMLTDCSTVTSPISEIMKSRIKDVLNNSESSDTFKEPVSLANHTPCNPRTKETQIIEISESDDESPLGACSARFRVSKAVQSTIPKPIFISHDDNVLSIESATYLKPTRILPKCPVCGKQVKDDINLHVENCLNTSGVLDDSVIEISDIDSPVAFVSSVNVPKPMVMPNKNFEPDIMMISDSDSVTICDNVTQVPKPIILPDGNSESEARIACRVCGMKFGFSKFNSHICY